MMDAKGVARIFRLLGLPVPDQARLDKIAKSGRSATQVRDDLLSWGKNQGGDTYANMIRSAVEARIGDAKTLKGQVDSIVDQIISGKATLDQKYADIDKYILKTGPSNDRGRDADEDDVPSLTILGGSSREILQDKSTGLYYVRYQLPRVNEFVLFEIEKEQFDALGLSVDGRINFNQAVKKGNIHFGGNVAEVEGSGDFDDEVQRVISLALDQGNLPSWIKDDPKALSLLYVKTVEERTDDWYYTQISTLDSFKKRYPGVKALTGRGLSVVEAIKAHTEFEIGLKTLHAASGFNDKAITPQHAADLLTRGYSLDQVRESYSVWGRMQKHAPALKAFNQVLQANGQKPLKGKAMFDFLKGNAPSELYDLYEASSIREAAMASGFGKVFDAKDALSMALGNQGQIGVDEAYQRFAGAAQQALRFRHELAIDKFGLDVDELIDISFGRAPRSGRSAAEVGEILSRVTNSAQAFLEGQAQPFSGFSEEGVPQARSLSKLRQSQ